MLSAGFNDLRKRRLFSFAVSVGLFFSLAGCSLEKMVVKEATGFMQKNRHVFEDEPDLELAEQSIAANLKLVEAMAAEDPENREINLLLAQLYSAYTLGFVEDKMDELAGVDYEESERHRRRAAAFYHRARDYAGKVILPVLGFSSPEEINMKNLPERLEKVGKDDLEGLFWFAFSWGAALNLQRDDVYALSRLGVIHLMMTRAQALDESYYFAGAVMFEGIYYGDRPAFLGGDAGRSQKAFDRAMKLTEKKFLMIPYFYARTYCVQQQDYASFQKSLQYIIDAPEDILPGQTLANNIAKRKAIRLLKRAPEFFIDAVE